ncbi:ammonium transporter [Candidatus Pseudothioglobus singularis]|jgi:Amt family ammonium transporter|nr:ammonium transporter [Candidatus Pseudothioglobus singularis]MDA8756006.1 ammonium transporter [Candidatus Pseudothioglobus singularis]MDB4597695.1 ammonium transporter [Candidatus Pseudothioglobus singularis]MDC1541370.1 ammonium transporter [Candidatus Pseudothioglobus singularis]MDC3245625.1 ammonium transporter [Candidatus Pseudothioglobus singularis]
MKYFILLALLPMTAFADVINGADTAWIMTSTALVLFMTLPGLALFYGGLVRSNNILSILMQCFAIAGIVSILWFIAGYSLAFSGDHPFIGDLSNFMLAKISIDSVSGSIPESLFAMFQMTFAIITPALIVGGYAERMKFSAVLLFSSIWLLIVYAPITHWVWGGGWLSDTLDYAGGTVVHITAGVAALVAAIVLGPRQEFLKRPIPPHNMTMTITGAAMLWVGWFGFNGGSALSAGGDAAMAILATHISAAAGAMTWMFYEWIKFGKPTALGSVTGMVAGLGTITPASGFVGPAGALVIGIIAGYVCFNAVIIIKQKFKIDDSLDVFPVHGVGGICGTILVGVFASKELGIFSGQGGWSHEAIVISDQLQIQFTAVVATAAYTAISTFIILKLVDLVTGLRVDSQTETQGLDLESHGEKGYDI